MLDVAAIGAAETPCSDERGNLKTTIGQCTGMDDNAEDRGRPFRNHGWRVTLARLGINLALALGANYGANLALFPSLTKDYYGLANFGINYGLVFTAWGFGGFLLALLAGKVYDETGSFAFAYYCSAALLALAACAALFIKPPHPRGPELNA